MRYVRYRAYIFDLDGTLLDTLPDLVRLTNLVLEDFGWPTRTRDEVLSFVGDGGRVLLQRAAPSDASAQELDEAFARWRELYPTFGHEMTRPYPGIAEMLEHLQRQGAKLGVLSNKFDAATRAVIGDHFPNVFDQVHGEREGVPRKPDPRGLLMTLDELGVSAGQAAYIGDSPGDMKVAESAGCAPIGVSWGYNGAEALLASGAQVVVTDPTQILSLF